MHVQASVEQLSTYPGTPSSSLGDSPTSGVSTPACLFFDMIFMNGTKITRSADEMTSVGWAVAEAAEFMKVPHRCIQLMRGTTCLYKLDHKLFDVLGPSYQLSVVLLGV